MEDGWGGRYEDWEKQSGYFDEEIEMKYRSLVEGLVIQSHGMDWQND
jgi:hypothetical protein